MKAYFSEEVLRDIRHIIHGSLIETFQILFHIDVVLMPQLAVVSGKDTICSYVEMTHKDAKIMLSVATSKSVIDAVCDGLEPGISPHSVELINDVSMEITNIVSNQLRTSMDTQHNVLFDLTLPQSCLPDCAKTGRDMLTVHFHITPDNSLTMEMTYTEPTGLIHVVV